jgi:hypothetical protein
VQGSKPHLALDVDHELLRAALAALANSAAVVSRLPPLWYRPLELLQSVPRARLLIPACLYQFVFDQTRAAPRAADEDFVILEASQPARTGNDRLGIRLKETKLRCIGSSVLSSSRRSAQRQSGQAAAICSLAVICAFISHP